MSVPCQMELYCQNSKMVSGMESRTKCALCRLSPENVGRDMVHHWQPSSEAERERKTSHPDLVREAFEKKWARRQAKLKQKRSRDPLKRTVSRKAAQAEKKTEAQIIHATKNSGRRNKDGDHVQAGMITLDTKLQTTRDNPVILLSELEKVRSDAKRAGKLIGGLVIRNKHGVGCVVLKEEDYALLTKGLLNESSNVGPVLPGAGQVSRFEIEGPEHEDGSGDRTTG